MLADVAERRGAQQRVADRVQQDVCVAVAEQSLVVRDLDPAHDELAPRDEAMDVEAVAYAHVRARCVPGTAG